MTASNPHFHVKFTKDERDDILAAMLMVMFELREEDKNSKAAKRLEAASQKLLSTPPHTGDD